MSETKRDIIAKFLITNDAGALYEEDEQAYEDADRLLALLDAADDSGAQQ